MEKTQSKSLFEQGQFKLASGTDSGFKIECDALTKPDWEAIASLMAKIVEPFDIVLGVPRGGLPLELAMKKYARPYSEENKSFNVLIVDDVWTTGGSMENFRDTYRKILTGNIKYEGAVVFARRTPATWTKALFTMNYMAEPEVKEYMEEVRDFKKTIFLSMPPKESLLSRIRKCYLILKG